jgi:hypothetical protein
MAYGSGYLVSTMQFLIMSEFPWNVYIFYLGYLWLTLKR